MRKSRLALIALAPTLAAATFLGVGTTANAGDDGINAVTTKQTRCYQHHVQKRTVTTYTSDGSNGTVAGTVAAATTYGPWVVKKRSC